MLFIVFNLFYLKIDIEILIYNLIILVLAVLNLYKYELIKDFSQIFIFLYLFFCHTSYPFLSYVGFFDLNESILNAQNLLSLKYYSIFFVTSTLFAFRNSNIDNSRVNERNGRPNYVLISGFLILIFTVTTISFVLGVGKMGEETVELPFKLTGILNFLRTDIIPFLVVFILIRAHLDNSSTFSIFFLFYLLWVAYEAFIRLSRSAFIENLIPLMAFNFLSGMYGLNKIFRVALFILSINFVLYPLISGLRNLEGGLSIENVKEAKSNTVDNQYQKIYTRTFSNTFFFEKYQNYLSNEIFDFKNLPAIFLLKGSHHFTTIIVDNLGIAANRHSSGTTGLMDAYLIGGEGVSLFLLFLITVLALRNDSPQMKRFPLSRVFGIYLIRWLVWYRSISLIFDPSQLIVFFILYFITRKK